MRENAPYRVYRFYALSRHLFLGEGGGADIVIYCQQGQSKGKQ